MDKKKKINVGILTLPFNSNYGGILQTYALQTYLKEKDYNAIHIYRDFPEKNKLVQIVKDLAKFLTGKTLVRKAKAHYPFQFFDKYVNPKTRRIRTISDFKDLKRYNFSTIIVGSDQVWRKEIAYGALKMNFFLDFAGKSTNKVSYAASFGLDSWQFDKEETEQIKKQILAFKAVSVREKSGVQLCENHLGIKATHVIDPVMLLPKEKYFDLLYDEEKDANGDCLVYLLDFTEQKQAIVNEISSKLNYKTYAVNKDIVKLGFRFKPSVKSWLKGFRDARFVVTDSFHGCLFSIIFNKPFLIIGNEKRGLARFNSLLSDFSLLDRMILAGDKNYLEIIEKPINWDTINKTLNKRREEAYQFLSTNIN
ncbi:polysaccharide pyruvyl transferase family protein [Maribellus maritimus]|uniref:polysaccharide pyruvyl transferase family protein n=1 Tax=Maribellus maritimus TaxID=2870838 RepID=UPI001EECAAAC|nr:polysaccharide pyruvyl transferase family protein [Maribellus maritimus]MCG6190239.1 polysaccharide pyruvyl transferase family protein [Maribellus maritimus]